MCPGAFFMPSSLAEWDAKHRAADKAAAPDSASIVSELLPLLPLGPALDVACGTGRHTLLLASRGQPVTAVDGSNVALDILERRALLAKYSINRVDEDPPSHTKGGAPARDKRRRVTATQRGIQLVHADLEQVRLPAATFAVILCVNYLQRSLFRQMEDALEPGGVLLFETYTRTQLEFEGGPRNPEYLLRSGELRTAFPGLEILFYRELRAGKGIASLLARKPAA
jgi:tellurite methyltransferase